ncbi:MAG: hypothetical protein LEGION0398_MBIBDBAK_00558 [Legionellaceae bacterium]
MATLSYCCCHDNVEQKYFKNLLLDFKSALYDYYLTEKKKEYTENAAIERSKEIYSAFLQSLFYYITHTTIPNPDKYLSITIEDKDFFSIKRNGRPVIWMDEKEKYTCLNSVVKIGSTEYVTQIIHLAKVACNEKDTEIFHNFITQGEKNGYSPLNTAISANHAEIVTILLDTAEKAYGGKLNQKFKNFLTQKNNYGFSPLNSAVKTGNLAIVNILLKHAEKAFTKIDSEDFQKFFIEANNDEFSSLNTAVNEGHYHLVTLLLDKAETVFGGIKRCRPRKRRRSEADSPW